MSVITDARDELHAALLATFESPVGGYAFTGRVDPAPPTKVAAPRVWIGESQGARRSQQYVVGFDVWVAVDGTPAKQVVGIDEVVGRIHDDAIKAGFDVLAHSPAVLPSELDPGSSVRAAVVTIERSARGLTLCPPD